MPSDRDTHVDDTMDARSADTGADTQGGAAAAVELGAMPTGNRRYRLGEVVGQGGMGEIVMATDAQIGREVAIKRMRTSTQSAARFLREARIQGRLDHPAIPPVHEVSVDDAGRPYFVMKLLAGTTLADIIDGETSAAASMVMRVPRQRLLRAFADVCLAVEFAHSRGIIHRDLKPANIMLGDFGEVYVLDWGVAYVTGEEEPGDQRTVDATATTQQHAGNVLGTIGYMSPEQTTGGVIDARADVYSLGCILFELLAGQPLHPRKHITAVFDHYDARPSNRAPDREIPPELDAVCVAATAADPALRPRSARELGERVQRYLDGDRDVALRQRLAREHLAQARAALVGGDRAISMTVSSIGRTAVGEVERRAAMQHAGRALALDPTAGEAAKLVGRLMLEPPAETPAEVEAELATNDDTNFRDQARLAAKAFFIGLCFLPLMYWVGVHDPVYLALEGGVFALNAAIALAIARGSGPVPAWKLYAIVALLVAMVAVLARMFTPFLVAPGLAVGAMLAVSMHPRFGRTPVLAISMCAAVIVPWVLDLTEVWPRTIGETAGALTLRSPGGDFVVPNVEIALALYVVAVVFIIGALANQMVQIQRAARRAAYLQSWHLKQLVPLSAE